MNANLITPLRSRAESFVDMGDLDKAETLYRDILSHDDKDIDANYMLGVLLAEKANISAAKEFLYKAIEINPEYPDTYFILAKIQQAQKEYQCAFDNCLKATSLDNEFDDAWLLLCALSTWLNDNVQAISSCKKAVNYYKDSIQANYNLASALFNERNYSEAAEYYKKTISLEPDNVLAKKYLCLSLLKNKEIKQALEIAINVLEGNSNDADFHNIVCEAYLELKEIENAVNSCNKALEIAPSDVSAHINMGNISQRKRQYDNAITWYTKALEIEPGNASIYHNLGITYLKLNDNDNASINFRKALDINPGFSVAKHMLAVAEGVNEARADNDYVTDLFDEYAHRYDKHQKDLKYRVPEHINNAIRGLYSEGYLNGKLDILDLGCGTGLCAPYLEDISKTIVGVDLSPDMIKQAEKLNLYNELVVGDMSECMNARPNVYDLAFAGDVFVYIGDLEQEFKAAKVALKEKALFVFTVQVNDDADSYELTDTGRYNHADSYISSLVKSSGFVKVSSNNIISRVDYGVPVNSRVYILQN